jgi:hypothetical protein
MKQRKLARSNGNRQQETTVQRPPELVSGDLSFEFIKGNFYRPIHVDGAFGGLSPTSRYIHMAVYSERQSIPTQLTHAVERGRLGQERTELRQGRAGLIREVEANLIIDLQTAISMRDWLDQRIVELAAQMTFRGELKVESSKVENKNHD